MIIEILLILIGVMMIIGVFALVLDSSPSGYYMNVIMPSKGIGNLKSNGECMNIDISCLVFCNRALIAHANTDHDFWIEVPEFIPGSDSAKTMAWIKFVKLHAKEKENASGQKQASFVATELTQEKPQSHDPIVSLRCVLWRRQEAILADLSIASYLAGFDLSD